MKRTDWKAGLNLTVLVGSLRNEASDQQAVAYHYAVPFPTRLAAGLSSRRHERSMRSDQVGLVVHPVALVQVLTRVLPTFHVTVIHQWCTLHHSSIVDLNIVEARGTKTFKIFRNHVETVGVRRLRWRKVHSEDEQILGAIIQTFVARFTWSPECVHILS